MKLWGIDFYLTFQLRFDWLEIKSMSIRDKAKSEHAKNAIFVWYIVGVILLLLGQMHGIPVFLTYFSIGIFIASFASIVTFLLRLLFWRVAGNGLGVFIFFIIDIGWIILASNLFLRIINGMFN